VKCNKNFNQFFLSFVWLILWKDSGDVLVCKGYGQKLLLDGCNLQALRQHSMRNHHCHPDQYNPMGSEVPFKTFFTQHRKTEMWPETVLHRRKAIDQLSIEIVQGSLDTNSSQMDKTTVDACPVRTSLCFSCFWKIWFYMPEMGNTIQALEEQKPASVRVWGCISDHGMDDMCDDTIGVVVGACPRGHWASGGLHPGQIHNPIKSNLLNSKLALVIHTKPIKKNNLTRQWGEAKAGEILSLLVDLIRTLAAGHPGLYVFKTCLSSDQPIGFIWFHR